MLPSKRIHSIMLVSQVELVLMRKKCSRRARLDTPCCLDPRMALHELVLAGALAVVMPFTIKPAPKPESMGLTDLTH